MLCYIGFRDCRAISQSHSGKLSPCTRSDDATAWHRSSAVRSMSHGDQRLILIAAAISRRASTCSASYLAGFRSNVLIT